MIKRQFGMAVLNITQGRHNDFSHKQFNAYDLAGMDSGIDKFVAFYSYEIIGVHKFNYSTGKGFANTVHFYDKENDVTIAMTHKDNLDSKVYYVGKVFNIGETMYLEGTAGRSTGNHIHVEIAKGKQDSKVQDKNGNWILKNWVNIEDYFFINKDYTRIQNDGGYKFTYEQGGETPIEPIPQPTNIEFVDCYSVIVIDKVLSAGYYALRDKALNGEIKYKASVKDYFEVLKISSQKLSDGYYWYFVRTYGGDELYIQYDSKYMHIENWKKE